MWLVTYFQYSHYKCIVTQNAQQKWDHAIKARHPRGGRRAGNGSCSTVLLFTLRVRPYLPKVIKRRTFANSWGQDFSQAGCASCHDAYIGGRSENNIKCVLHDDLRQKNRTTRYNCRFSAASLASRVIFSVS